MTGTDDRPKEKSVAGGGMVTRESAREAFRRDGFVVIEGLLTNEELARYGHAVDAGVRHRKSFDTRALHEKTRYEQCFQQCMNLWEDCPDVRPLTFHPRIGQAAAELLGVPALRLWHDQALYKEAGGIETDTHQDQPYWPMVETDTITAWVPFDGSTLENGAMGYVPGSHRIGLRRFVNIFGKEKPAELLEREELKGREPVFVEVPAGAVAFHHGLTVHCAKPNRTDATRRVHTMIMFADGATRAAKGEHWIVDRPGIPVGGRIDSPCTPIVWPRAPGDLPEPPAIPLDEEAFVFAKLGFYPQAEN